MQKYLEELEQQAIKENPEAYALMMKARGVVASTAKPAVYKEPQITQIACNHLQEITELKIKLSNLTSDLEKSKQNESKYLKQITELTVHTRAEFDNLNAQILSYKLASDNTHSNFTQKEEEVLTYKVAIEKTLTELANKEEQIIMHKATIEKALIDLASKEEQIIMYKTATEKALTDLAKKDEQIEFYRSLSEKSQMHQMQKDEQLYNMLSQKDALLLKNSETIEKLHACLTEKTEKLELQNKQIEILKRIAGINENGEIEKAEKSLSLLSLDESEISNESIQKLPYIQEVKSLAASSYYTIPGLSFIDQVESIYDFSDNNQ